MELGDSLYRLGDRIGWDRCDYARTPDGETYGITDGHVTLATTPIGDEIYWETSADTEDGVDPIDAGTTGGSVAALHEVWLRAVTPAVDRATVTVSRLTGEGWRTRYTEDGIVIGHGWSAVVITDDGAVISSDPVARLHAHSIYYPEVYAAPTMAGSR